MSKLSEFECNQMASLMRRATKHGQLTFGAATPDENGNEQFMGNATTVPECLIETEYAFGEDHNGEPENELGQYEVHVYVPQDSLEFITNGATR